MHTHTNTHAGMHILTPMHTNTHTHIQAQTNQSTPKFTSIKSLIQTFWPLKKKQGKKCLWHWLKKKKKDQKEKEKDTHSNFFFIKTLGKTISKQQWRQKDETFIDSWLAPRANDTNFVYIQSGQVHERTKNLNLLECTIKTWTVWNRWDWKKTSMR